MVMIIPQPKEEELKLTLFNLDNLTLFFGLSFTVLLVIIIFTVAFKISEIGDDKA